MQMLALAQLHLEGTYRCRLFPLQPVCFWEEAQKKKKNGVDNVVMSSDVILWVKFSLWLGYDQGP